MEKVVSTYILTNYLIVCLSVVFIVVSLIGFSLFSQDTPVNFNEEEKKSFERTQTFVSNFLSGLGYVGGAGLVSVMLLSYMNCLRG